MENLEIKVMEISDYENVKNLWLMIKGFAISEGCGKIMRL